MTLSEYITSEFGIVPDDVQLETIRLISFMELNKEFDLNNINPDPLPKYCKVKNKEYCFLHDQCQECTDNNSIK